MQPDSVKLEGRWVNCINSKWLQTGWRCELELHVSPATSSISRLLYLIMIPGQHQIQTLTLALFAAWLSCSNQSGPPPWRICSLNHTRLMKAHNVQVTTKQPWKQSEARFSLEKTKQNKHTIYTFAEDILYRYSMMEYGLRGEVRFYI